MKKTITVLAFFALIGFLFSCSELPPPNDKNPYKPMRASQKSAVVGTIETTFSSYGIAGYRDENKNISEEAYLALLKIAKEKYGINVDIVDVTWIEVQWVSGLNNPSEFSAKGKVITTNQFVGLEGALAKASKDAMKNVPQNSIIAIVYITADDIITTNYISDELEFIWFNEGFIISDRSQLTLLRQEQNFQINGEVDDASAVSIGKFLGANVIITGKIDGRGDLRRLRLRVLNTQTGQVIGVASERL